MCGLDQVNKIDFTIYVLISFILLFHFLLISIAFDVSSLLVF